jgi:HAE1 family hydrophobic/amphiphilic exporter-1
VVVLLAIPTSMISTFFMMYLFNFTLDTVSLMALALLVGILVDDSIVVLENIHRHRQLGEEPLLAAINGRNEIGLAAVAITLADVVVWVPIAFISGSLGVILREFALTIVAATLFSLFVSFTLTPMLAAHWLRPEKVEEVNRRARRGLLAPFRSFGPGWEAGMDQVRQGYRLALAWSLQHRALVLLAGAAAFGVAIAMILLNVVGKEYAPIEDDAQFSLQVQMPPGSSLQTTSAAMAELEQRLQELPEVQHVFSSVGGGGFFASQTNSGNLSVLLVDKNQRRRSTLEVLEEARGFGRTVPNMTVTGSLQSALGGGGTPINIRILGSDINRLQAAADQVQKVLARTPGTTDIRLQQPPGAPAVEATVDRSRAAPLGIAAADVASTVRAAVGGTTVSRFKRPDGTESDVVMLVPGANTMTPAELGALPIFAPAIGRAVRLDQVAALRATTGPSQINRVAAGQAMFVSVSAGVSGRPLGDVAAEAKAQIDKLQLPQGVRVAFFGQVNRLNDAFRKLLGAAAISAVLMFMLLAALYESLRQPLAIMFSVPLALVGALVGLQITGNTLNLFSMIAMILLMGLVAKNAILLVDYTNTLRQRGLARREAIIEAGATRLRPILMTSSTIVCAMIPLALKLEAGAESRSPIAVAVIGGVLSSLALTLVVVPVVYTVLDDIGGLLPGMARLPERLKTQIVRSRAASSLTVRQEGTAEGSPELGTKP